ncbi:hypothetical protein G7Z17_g8995 [Cylindrodendrum hubeiense]|uniref:Uncharacterized protein n=1 Tax=Cylindrodendrum hubeiense TaxID=595255 RepID=A0A9P5H2F1_9HYPO|nr:hypothetical protein G7Z17_g8995 [Cylindrodendrum hubeiense]
MIQMSTEKLMPTTVDEVRALTELVKAFKDNSGGGNGNGNGSGGGDRGGRGGHAGHIARPRPHPRASKPDTPPSRAGPLPTPTPTSEQTREIKKENWGIVKFGFGTRDTMVWSPVAAPAQSGDPTEAPPGLSYTCLMQLEAGRVIVRSSELYDVRALMMISIVFVFFCVPETKGIPLEAMDRLFEIKPIRKAHSTVLEELRLHDEEFRQNIAGVDLKEEKAATEQVESKDV